MRYSTRIAGIDRIAKPKDSVRDRIALRKGRAHRTGDRDQRGNNVGQPSSKVDTDHGSHRMANDREALNRESRRQHNDVIGEIRDGHACPDLGASMTGQIRDDKSVAAKPRLQ
jgi:hypothetical protein